MFLWLWPVSLALAGVLAVSMLAGCSTNGTTPDNGEENPVVTTSGISAAVEARLATKLPTYITFADSTELDADLKYATEYVGVREILDGFVNVNNMLKAVASPEFVKVLREEVGDTKDGVFIENIGSNWTLIDAEKDAGKETTLPDVVAVGAYAISGQIGENAVQQKIADEIDTFIGDYQYTVDAARKDLTGGNFNYSYEVSVSTCTVDTHSAVVGNVCGIIGAENPDVTYVAIQVVRTAAHQ